MGRTATRSESESSAEILLAEDREEVIPVLSQDAKRSAVVQKIAEKSFLVMLGMPDDSVVWTKKFCCGGEK